MRCIGTSNCTVARPKGDWGDRGETSDARSPYRPDLLLAFLTHRELNWVANAPGNYRITVYGQGHVYGQVAGRTHTFTCTGTGRKVVFGRAGKRGRARLAEAGDGGKGWLSRKRDRKRVRAAFHLTVHVHVPLVYVIPPLKSRACRQGTGTCNKPGMSGQSTCPDPHTAPAQDGSTMHTGPGSPAGDSAAAGAARAGAQPIVLPSV
jgi:hypothetical protein